MTLQTAEVLTSENRCIGWIWSVAEGVSGAGLAIWAGFHEQMAFGLVGLEAQSILAFRQPGFRWVVMIRPGFWRWLSGLVDCWQRWNSKLACQLV